MDPPWSVIEFTFSNNDTDSELVVMCNYRQFIISVSADSFAQSAALRNKYLFLLEVADNHELDGYTVEDLPDIPRELKQSWAQQVHDTVQQLHAAGIAWGDAKPDNVLVVRANDAWVIDFGGGHTNGWVPKELSGTLEGDLQALKKIDDFLLEGQMPA
ncbi:kinase subdomain protein [Fusarium tjaetaba]|uniref:Kinase subdomain protein n=1 Tax=Fusarium tjaetaba TaxID=1567544 RepID=A0A8H5QQA3_9HYPO|nr:kinase subdomain protein [Fusarium tjaetaba]KAF5620890.1 kinase subdomain protein [Fusarium tjaetaba]